MCGIAGWLSWSQSPSREPVADMCAAQAHRGPDATGLAELGPVILGHRRLSIIDLSFSNNQPLFDESGRFAITYNGEIYNFREIRRELESCGARFRTQGDTEVILEAYKAWDVDCLNRFNGMFAFALWDSPRRQLFLARDRAGEKPLFYYPLPDGGLVFASEPKALRRHPAVSRRVDPVALAHYLSLNYTVGERCLNEGMRRLSPGHFMIVEPGRTKIAKYWDLAAHFRAKRNFVSEAEAADELVALIDDAVRLRMVSDVPLGAFLSGGIDSSTVVAAMTRHCSSDRIKTFSIGFDEPTFDEIPEARNVARALNVDHRDDVLRPGKDVLFESLVAGVDEPLADSSVMPTWFLAGFARQHVTVALSGDGGDECFAGYETYAADRMHSIFSRLPGWYIRGMKWAVDALMPVSFAKVSFDYKLRQFVAGLLLDGPRAHYSWRTIFSDDERQAMMRPQWRPLTMAAEADAFTAFQDKFAEVADCHPIDQATYVDIKTWLTDDILVKVDRATMAHSLEARVPFLDHRIMEFAASLPVSWKLKWLRGKHMLKRSQGQRLPARVLSRRKRGFNAPVSNWLVGSLQDLARDVLADRAIDDWFVRAAIERLWQDHLRKSRDNGLKLLGLINFALWIKSQ
ncbi:MAG: asparagine synthase (glutamine-hydrolyzing) [Gammaproteobacteria bacterium]